MAYYLNKERQLYEAIRIGDRFDYDYYDCDKVLALLKARISL
jgi:hypothetical protein